MQPPRRLDTLSRMAESNRDRSNRSSDWTNRHIWHIQPVRDLLVIAIIVGLIYLGYLLRIVTAPLLLAMALAYLFEPIVRRMVSTRFFNRAGAAITIILAVAVFIVIPAVIGLGYAAFQGGAYANRFANNVIQLNRSVMHPDDEERRDALPGESWRFVRDQLVESRRRAEEEAPEADEQSEPDSENDESAEDGESPDAPENTDSPEETDDREEADSFEDTDEFNEYAQYEYDDRPADFISQLFEQAAAWVEDNRATIGRRAYETGTIAAGVIFRGARDFGILLFGGFLTAFFFFFMCKSYGKVLEFWEDLIPERKRGKAIELAKKMDRAVAAFVRGRITIAIIQIVYFTLAYWLIGVPAPILVGIIVGLLCLIPYISMVGVPLTMLLMWLEPSGVSWQATWWWIVLAPIGAYLIGQAMDEYFLTPVIQGKGTGMDIPTILFASIAGGALAGMYGLLIAIPVAACIKILLTDVVWPKFKRWTQGVEKDPLPIESESESEGDS